MSTLLYAAQHWMAYLQHPPSSSWVVRVAATFRILALLLILPCILLTALDVASYLIVRTLGADSVHKLDPATTSSAYAAGNASASPGPTADDGSRKAPTIVLAAADEHHDHHDAYFTTPSESNPALFGEGIFSPPPSRSSSPPTTRNNRKTNISPTLTVTDADADGDDAAALRKRVHASLES